MRLTGGGGARRLKIGPAGRGGGRWFQVRGASSVGQRLGCGMRRDSACVIQFAITTTTTGQIDKPCPAHQCWSVV